MATKFTLEIEMGNDMMRRPSHVADALAKVAKRILDGSDGGKIMDMNGNSVGRFDFTD